MAEPVANKEEALRRLRASGGQLAKLGVARVGLFGSFVKGSQSPSSDVDILVDFAPTERSFDNFMDLSFFLEELMGRRVELVTTESLSPYIGPRVLREVERVEVGG